MHRSHAAALLLVPAGLALASACVSATVPSSRGVYPAYRLRPVEEVRDAFTAVLERPSSDLEWIEVTLLDPIVVEREADERARLGGVGEARAVARKAELRREATDGRAVLEAWLSTTCTACRDLRDWTFVLTGPGDAAHRPRWVTSDVARTQADTLRVLDATREVERAWVRGRLTFAPDAVPTTGVLRLTARRPESWAEPMDLVWRFDTAERVWAPGAWLAGVPDRLLP